MDRKQRRKALEASLLTQLKGKQADLPHFSELVAEYLKFWDISNELSDDIEKRGAVYQDVSSVGVMMWKNNPSVKEKATTSRQMLQILQQLKITTDSVEIDGPEEM